jgi:hypothetical protein
MQGLYPLYTIQKQKARGELPTGAIGRSQKAVKQKGGVARIPKPVLARPGPGLAKNLLAVLALARNECAHRYCDIFGVRLRDPWSLHLCKTAKPPPRARACARLDLGGRDLHICAQLPNLQGGCRHDDYEYTKVEVSLPERSFHNPSENRGHSHQASNAQAHGGNHTS